MLQLAKCNRNLQEVLEVGQTSQGSGGSSLKSLLSRRNQKFKAAVSQVVPKTSTELFFFIVFHRQETLQQNAHLQSQACANGFKALEWRQEVQTLKSTDPQGPEKQQPHSSSKVLTSLEPVSQVHAMICQARFNSLAWILEFN